MLKKIQAGLLAVILLVGAFGAGWYVGKPSAEEVKAYKELHQDRIYLAVSFYHLQTAFYPVFMDEAALEASVDGIINLMEEYRETFKVSIEDVVHLLHYKVIPELVANTNDKARLYQTFAEAPEDDLSMRSIIMQTIRGEE